MFLERNTQQLHNLVSSMPYHMILFITENKAAKLFKSFNLNKSL